MLHPVLAGLFADLDDVGLRWALLRVPSTPQAPTGDVDLLVHAGDLERARRVLLDHRFYAVPGWASPPSLLFMTYDQASGCCLLLEITDEVSFGPGLLLRTGLANELLTRTRTVQGMRVLEKDDAFWVLLLHCLLDKGAVPGKYWARLQSMSRRADAAGAFPRLIETYLPADRQPEQLRAFAEAGRWRELTAAGSELSAAWRRSLPLSARKRPVALATRRVLRAPLLVHRRFGISVALLGPNGAGKSTLASGIEQAWPLPARQVYMGLWKSGATPGQEIPGVAQLMRLPIAWIRFLKGASAQIRGELVVFDRYVDDARLPPAPPFVRAKQMYLWVLARGVPAPDLLFVLDVPGEISAGRKAENTVQEAQVEHAEYRVLADSLPNARLIDARGSIDSVRAEALQVIWERCLQRWQAPAARVPWPPRRKLSS